MACNSRDEEQRAHTTDEHHAADDNLAYRGKLPGKSHRKPAGTVGADDLEQHLEEGGAVLVEPDAGGDFGAEQDHGRKCDDHDGHDEDSHGLVDRGFGNGAAEDLGLLAAEQPVESEQADNRSRGDLDAATAASGVRTDEHDDDKEEQRGGAERRGVHRVQSGGAARERHECRGLELVEEA